MVPTKIGGKLHHGRCREVAHVETSIKDRCLRLLSPDLEEKVKNSSPDIKWSHW